VGSAEELAHAIDNIAMQTINACAIRATLFHVKTHDLVNAVIANPRDTDEMSEHYTSGSESELRWCNHCERRTRHKISGHQLGRCMEHAAPQLTHKQQKHLEEQRREAAQPRLFQ
jgi:hypothetical protein